MYTETQLLKMLRSIPRNFQFEITDGIYGIMPLLKVATIINNTPEELLDKYKIELKELTNIAKDLYAIADRCDVLVNCIEIIDPQVVRNKHFIREMVDKGGIKRYDKSSDGIKKAKNDPNEI